MFNNNGAEGSSAGPYDYIGSAAHGRALQRDAEASAEQAARDGMLRGANSVTEQANIIIGGLNRDREQLILQVQNLQTKLNEAYAKSTRQNKDADEAIDEWEAACDKLRANLNHAVGVANSRKHTIDDLTQKNEVLVTTNQALLTQNKELSGVIVTLQTANAKLLSDLRSMRKSNEISAEAMAAEIRSRESSTIFIHSVTGMLNELMTSGITREEVQRKFDEHYSAQLNLAMDLGIIHESIAYSPDFVANYPTTAALIGVLMKQPAITKVNDLTADPSALESEWHTPNEYNDHVRRDDALDPLYGT